MLAQFHFREAVSLKRNYGLDILRFIAILLVVFCHGIQFLPPLPNATLIFHWTGLMGVEVFFVLSGYLIGTILLDLFLDQQGGSFFQHLPSFWIRRWFRTLPNYYLFLLIYIAFAMYTVTDLDHWRYYVHLFSRYFCLTQNMETPIEHFMPVSWSLTVEEWFYLSFPVTLALLSRRSERSLQTFLRASIAYALFFCLLRIALSFVDGMGEYNSLRQIVLSRLDAIAYGAIMMAVMRAYPTFMYGRRYHLLALGVAGLALSTLWLNQMVYTNTPPLMNALYFTLTGISSAFLLPAAVYQTERSGKSVLRSIIAGTSIISYSMYLIHPLISTHLVSKWCGEWPWYFQFSTYLAITYVLSFLTYTQFERRVTALRDRFAVKSAVEL